MLAYMQVGRRSVPSVDRGSVIWIQPLLAGTVAGAGLVCQLPVVTSPLTNIGWLVGFLTHTFML